MQVEIVTPEKVLFSGEASMVIAKGSDGEVGVLAGHEPMVLTLAYGELRLYVGESVAHRFAVYGGFLEVRNDVVSVLTDDAEDSEVIDASEARQELDQLESHKPAEDEEDAHEAALSRARVRAAVVAA
jgi:F-type H+-transporting ATPase subunit epsilon